MKRRQFIKIGLTATCMTMMPVSRFLQANTRKSTIALSAVQKLPSSLNRIWLGESFWANRLQDWQVNNGRIECIRGEKSFEVRTFSLLTRSLNNSHSSGRVRATVGNLTPKQHGFCGFLFGAGAGELDYKARALTQRAAGVNGGFMAVIDTNGNLSFKDFSDTKKPLDFATIKQTNLNNSRKFSSAAITLDCQIEPSKNGLFDVHFTAYDAKSTKELGYIVRKDVPKKELYGGILMLSSPPSKKAGARWWFDDIETGGDKISVNPEHELGPVIGCMHSVNRTVLKLTAQFMPVSSNEYSQARLDFSVSGTDKWTKGPIAELEDGFLAAFRVTSWDSTIDHDYRVVANQHNDTVLFSGQVVKDPGNAKALKIALHSCLTATSKSVDIEHYTRRIKEERVLGRWTKDNILFPHTELVKNCDLQEPDLFIFCGDQFYENVPTRVWRNMPDSKLDLLYRWYLWYWSFSESIRNRPSIVLADDHDVLQGNLWGVGGRDPVVLEKQGHRKEEDGGYIQAKDLVKMVYRIEHGHNPDAYDPTPIDHGIPVTYGSFVYGGVSFSVIEDRKFKSRRNVKIDPCHAQGELLGHRQEQFLRAWKDMDKDLPKICIAASMWGSAQTKGDLIPLLDYDSNGYPPDGRTRAVQLIKDAGAIVLCGDQHIAMVAKQGINTFDDGPTFFAGPAGAAFWQRWFEGEGKLSNKRHNDPNTGDFTDTFGNKMRVLAVANPKVEYKVFKEQVGDSWSNSLADRNVKSEGYGLVKVNHQRQQFEMECWAFDANPKTDKQFSGWPYVHTFGESGK